MVLALFIVNIIIYGAFYDSAVAVVFGCDNIPSNNTSLLNACSNCGGSNDGTRYGTAWINDGSGDKYSQIVNVGANETSKTVYLYGNYYQCGGSSNSSYFMGYYVKLLDSYPSGNLWGTDDRNVIESFYNSRTDFRGDTFAPIKLSENTINRGYGAAANTFSTNFKSIKGTLDVQTLRNNLGSYEYDSSLGAYVAYVYVYRCPNTREYCLNTVNQGSVPDHNVSGIDESVIYFKLADCPDGNCGGDCPDGDCPELSCGDTTKVDIAQRNIDVPRYSSWTDGLIYAKPTDEIEYTYEYCAGVQQHAFEYVTHNNECVEGVDYDTENDNRYFKDEIGWKNYYITADPGDNNRHSFAIGNSVTDETKQSYTIEPSDVGDTLEGSVESSYPTHASSEDKGIHTWTYHYAPECEGEPDENGNPTIVACECEGEPDEQGNPTVTDCSEDHPHKHTNNYYKYNAGGTDSKSVEVRIPYNYIIEDGSNPSRVNISTRDGDPVYAGEKFTISSIEVGTNEKYSSTLNQTYATRTQNATIRIYSFWFDYNASIKGGDTQISSSSSACSYYGGKGCESDKPLNTTSSVLNKGSDLDGAVDVFFRNETYSVFDIAAGSKLCVAYDVSIAESNNNPDTNSTNGYRYVSKATCRTVAKKPLFQVWGGSIYSNGKIAVNTIAKNNLANNFRSWSDAQYGYNIGKGHTTINFTPWVELSVVAKRTVSGLASGAATGYTRSLGDNSDDTPAADPGGKTINSNFCNASYLTIANCDSSLLSTIGNSGIEVGTSTRDSLKKEYIDNNNGKFKNYSGSQNLTTIENLADANCNSINGCEIAADHNRTFYTKGSNLTISQSQPLKTNTTHIIYSTGGITIASNLRYTDAVYQSTNQVPQYFIYADGDIKINCEVQEVDAFLIATGKIITCANPSGDSGNAKNAANRSTQLKIKGAIIAGSLDLGRTYGAATGANTMVPAEIIDFSPMTYFWSKGNASDTPTLHTTYTRELAPRY